MKLYTCIGLVVCVAYAVALPAAAPELVPGKALHEESEVLEPQESRWGRDHHHGHGHGYDDYGHGGHHHGHGGHHYGHGGHHHGHGHGHGHYDYY